MCLPTSTSIISPKKDNNTTLKILVGGLSICTIGLLISTIVLIGVNNGNENSSSNAASPASLSLSNGIDFMQSKASSDFFSSLEDNVCAGAKLALENKLCADLEVPAPQAGANVTLGYVGNMDVGDIVPNIKPFYQSNMCPVNVHWHLGTEHYSYGQFDENGNGPNGNTARPEWANRDLADTKDVRDGFRCHHYDATDEKFTKPFEWKHCVGMEVGETYEVHW